MGRSNLVACAFGEGKRLKVIKLVKLVANDQCLVSRSCFRTYLILCSRLFIVMCYDNPKFECMTKFYDMF